MKAPYGDRDDPRRRVSTVDVVGDRGPAAWNRVSAGHRTHDWRWAHARVQGQRYRGATCVRFDVHRLAGGHTRRTVVRRCLLRACARPLDAYLSAWVASLDQPERMPYGDPPGDVIWVPRVAGLGWGSIVSPHAHWARPPESHTAHCLDGRVSFSVVRVSIRVGRAHPHLHSPVRAAGSLLAPM